MHRQISGSAGKAEAEREPQRGLSHRLSSWLLHLSFWISSDTDVALLAGGNENGVACSIGQSGVEGTKGRVSDGEPVIITQTNINHRDVGRELLLGLSLKKILFLHLSP